MKYLFVVPGSPAPIGGFKLLYEYGRILINEGHDVRFLLSKFNETVVEAYENV